MKHKTVKRVLREAFGEGLTLDVRVLLRQAIAAGLDPWRKRSFMKLDAQPACWDKKPAKRERIVNGKATAKDDTFHQ